VITSSSIASWLRKAAAEVASHRDELTALDAAIGDADHGINLQRGFAAVLGRMEAGNPAEKTPAALSKEAGMVLVASVGGASGPLYGTFFLRFGGALGDQRELDAATLAAAFRAGLEGIRQRGKAELGEKTMIDAWQPAVEALESAVAAGKPLEVAMWAAAAAAQAGAEATTPMVARKGRASYMGERSRGHQDPGATSTALLVKAAAEAFSERE